MTGQLFEQGIWEVSEPPLLVAEKAQEMGKASVELGDALSFYDEWPAPTVIVADGPYGLGSFPGDPPTPAELAEWYEPHAEAWSRCSLPETTLWFWGSEVGWATVHPVLERHGFEYKALHVWDKGIGHVAGNVNSKTIRGFPVVTEVCARYAKKVRFRAEDDSEMLMKEWMRAEWLRSGLPLYKTNEACGVKNAATRKYFTQCHLWYFPPPDMMEKLVSYANEHGKPEGRPYFSLDGEESVTAEQWARMRAKWNHTHGVTNVWSEPAIRGSERLKNANAKCLHMNQKPLKIMKRLVEASSDPGDVVWEPFGGLCSTAVASIRTDRHCYSAEINPDFYEIAEARLEEERSNLEMAAIERVPVS